MIDSYDFAGHEMASDGKNAFYLNTYDNVILKLDCPTDIASCKWVQLQQTLSMYREWALAFLVPDDLTKCTKTKASASSVRRDNLLSNSGPSRDKFFNPATRFDDEDDQ